MTRSRRRPDKRERAAESEPHEPAAGLPRRSLVLTDLALMLGAGVAATIRLVRNNGTESGGKQLSAG
jgi:hypothetical protein